MSGFFANLGRNLRELPANLREGLLPGHDPETEASPKKRLRRSFVYHLHPLTVSRRALRPGTTLGLGLISATLLGLLTISGLLLMIYYAPDPARAHGSMLDLQHAVTFGAFLRTLHRWATYALLFTVVVHGLRVIFQAAYRGRELNWLLGLGLLSLVLLLAFTGYLLPWDQRSVWATVVTAELLGQLPGVGEPLARLFLGGPGVGEATLLRFYTLHVAVGPAAILGALALHLWRVRRDGGLAVSEREQRGPLLPAWPHLVHREAILALGVVTILVLLSSFFPASLGAVADLDHPTNPEKAPWFFVGLQEMVSYSAGIGGFLFPGALALLLLLLPFLDREESGVGRWLGDRAQRRSALLAALLGLGLFLALAARRLATEAERLATGDWVNPATGMLLFSLLLFFGVGATTRSTRAGLRAALIVLGVALLGFTLLGQLRGPDWVLELASLGSGGDHG